MSVEDQLSVGRILGKFRWNISQESLEYRSSVVGMSVKCHLCPVVHSHVSVCRYV